MSRKYTTEEFQDRLNSIFGDKFTVVSKYINNQTKINIKCNDCGNIIQKQPSKMTSAKEGCYICNGKNHHKTKESFQKEVDQRFPNTYEILEEYEKARKPLLILNKKCGHEYKISPDNLLRGKGCPRCSIKQSSYMDIVETYLEEKGFLYEKEKTFEECKNIRCLPFDYYIPSLNCCIEVDGEFHYNKTKVTLNRRSAYELVKCRDLLKDEFCKKSGIKLIRLPYFEKKNFYVILDHELNVNTEITTGNKKSVVL